MSGLNRVSKMIKWIGVIVLGIVILLAILFSFRKGTQETLSVDREGNLLNHPIYSKYVFDNTDRVINIGVQPLYLPTGLISEAMKRDGILQKALKDLGMELKYYPFFKGDDVNFFLYRGDIDFGIGGDMPALSAASTTDVIIPVILQQGFSSILATRPMMAKQLRGKRIAYPFGSIAHFVVLDVLASEEIKESAAVLVPMDIPRLAQALNTGEIDAFAAWEPISAISKKTHKDFVVIYQQMTTGYMYVLTNFFEKNPEATREIVTSVVRAFRWMKKKRENLLHAGEWAKQAGESLGAQKIPLSSKEMADLAQKDILGLTSVPLISSDDLRHNGPLHREFRFLKTLGTIPPSATWERVRNSSDLKILNEVLVNQVRFGLHRFDYLTGSPNKEYGEEK